MKRFYALELTKRGAKVSRFALYEILYQGVEITLEVVWPHTPEHKVNLWPCQVFHKPDNFQYPAYHFKVGNVGYSKLQYLKESLKEMFAEEITIEIISGWAPGGNY